jgi:hypothetical protein
LFQFDVFCIGLYASKTWQGLIMFTKSTENMTVNCTTATAQQKMVATQAVMLSNDTAALPLNLLHGS